MKFYLDNILINKDKGIDFKVKKTDLVKCLKSINEELKRLQSEMKLFHSEVYDDLMEAFEIFSDGSKRFEFEGGIKLTKMCCYF